MTCSQSSFGLRLSREQVFKHLSLLPFAPSVQMHDVPTESLGEHLGFAQMKQDDNQESEELDEKLGRESLFLSTQLQRFIS